SSTRSASLFLMAVDALSSGPPSSHWSRWLPTSVNDTYGDPFIPEQAVNTRTKLLELMTQQAPIAVFTKAGWGSGALREIRPAGVNRKVVIFYSLTGLDEGGISFASRVRMIEALSDIFAHVVVFTRPIIRGRNDDPVTLQRLVDVAASHSRYL